MEYKPRDYQQECDNDLMNYLNQKNPKPALVTIPTGGGKSYSIAKLTHEYDGKALILCPSQEILEQNYLKFISFGGEAGIFSSALGSKAISRVTYATIGTVKKMPEVFKNFGVSMLVIDEAHEGTDPSKGMFKDFFKILNPKYTIGFTATPFRLKNYTDPSGYNYSQLTMMNRSSPKLFSNLVHVTQISHLVNNNFWAPVEVHIYDFNPLGLVLNSTGSDYTESSISAVIKTNNINNKIYKLAKSLISDGINGLLVYLDSVENCYIMANALGKYVRVIDGDTPKGERRKIIEDFKAGKIKALILRDTLVTGFDFPKLDHVIMGRPTNSLAVFYQLYGRLVRPFEGKIGHFYDFGGNYNKFGRPEDLTIEDYNDYGWGVFSGDNLLTGKPMGGPPVYKSDLDNIQKQEFKNSKLSLFEFGMYKLKPLDEVPLHYMEWACKNAKSNMSETLYNECIKRMTANR